MLSSPYANRTGGQRASGPAGDAAQLRAVRAGHHAAMTPRAGKAMVVITPILDVRHQPANHPPWVKTILLGPLLAIGLSIPGHGREQRPPGAAYVITPGSTTSPDPVPDRSLRRCAPGPAARR